MAVRCDKNIFTSWECGQKRREKREANLTPTLDCENDSKHLLELLGGRDKQVQRTGVCCFRAVNQPCHLAMCWQSHLQVLRSLIDQVEFISYALGILFVVRRGVLFVQQIPFQCSLVWMGIKRSSNQTSWFMHELQSWEIRVVCLIQVQKCVDLAHCIRLELESLEG